MNEISKILKAYDAAAKTGKRSAIASVVHLNGSSYRRPGARMLITEEGELTGAISGGCLEGDALAKAMMVLSQHQSRLVTYDTSDEEDATIGFQLGCEGVIRVLFEPIDPNNPDNPIALLRKAGSVRQQSVLVTLFSLNDKRNAQPGSCLLLEESGDISGTIPYPALLEAIRSDMQYAMQLQTSFFKNYTHENFSISAFIEFLQPPVSLVVVGAGNDAIAMLQVAASIGWDVRIVDGRSSHARPERFAAACQVIVSKPEKALKQLAVDGQTAFILMTHNYNYDLAMLRALLSHGPAYIGVLGPKKKFNRMLDELRNDGIDLGGEQLDAIYSPAGLEIGAETPEEIALSIIAEIKAVLAGKKGGSLRLKKDAIHAETRILVEEKKNN